MVGLGLEYDKTDLAFSAYQGNETDNRSLLIAEYNATATSIAYRIPLGFEGNWKFIHFGIFSVFGGVLSNSITYNNIDVVMPDNRTISADKEEDLTNSINFTPTDTFNDFLITVGLQL